MESRKFLQFYFNLKIVKVKCGILYIGEKIKIVTIISWSPSVLQKLGKNISSDPFINKT